MPDCTHPVIPDNDPIKEMDLGRFYGKVSVSRKSHLNFCILCGKYMDFEAMGRDRYGNLLEPKIA